MMMTFFSVLSIGAIISDSVKHEIIDTKPNDQSKNDQENEESKCPLWFEVPIEFFLRN